MDVTTTSDFTIIVNQITTGLGSTGEDRRTVWPTPRVTCYSEQSDVELGGDLVCI